MQILNQNQPTNPQLGLNLPKPVPPQSATAQTNTPIKVPNPLVNTQKANPAQINLTKQVKLPSATQKVVAPVNVSSPGPASTTSPASAAGKVVVPAQAVAPAPALVQTPTPSVAPSSPAKTMPKANSNKDKVVPTEEIGKKAKEKPSKKWKISGGKTDKKTDNKAAKKKIPTLLGLLILIVSMVAGVLLFGNGTGLFAPRATPATTPQNIVVSNVTDKAFTVSFYTDEEIIASVKYGPSANDIKQQASDDRDQLSGVIKPYRLHHITVRGLEPNTSYYYNLSTGSNSSFDNNGAPYQITTASSLSNASPNNQTIYGTVAQMSGQPGEGAIVFVTPEGAGALSTLVKSSGSWAVSLANAFNSSLNAYPQVSEDTVLSIKVQGIDLNSVSNRVVNVAGAQPVPEIIVGQEASEESLTTREELLAEEFESSENSVDSEELETHEVIQEEASTDANLAQNNQLENEWGEEEITALADSQRILDLNEVDEASTAQDNVITSTQPIIKANLPPNVTVKIEIHSDTAIETIVETDADGNVEVDIASLKKNLSPGEHSINYTYIDPGTGQEVSKSYNFTVSPPGSNIENETRPIASAQTGSDLPHGTGDPYLPVKDVTPTPVPTVEPIEEATASIRETVVSTQSGTYNAGSTFNTLSLLVIGLFFVATGTWSFFLAKQFSKDF